MKILAVDIGTGTQDIFLYDSNLDLENGFKLVLPSPTMMVHRRLKQALPARTPILLTGSSNGRRPLRLGHRRICPRGDTCLHDAFRCNDDQ
ncbi:MAG: hypothetical protein MZU97_07575 [Bacillus subtilis]|nr:hypothetical protein [Bacillus subtilis]